MNVYEYSLHAVGFLPGECESPEGHHPYLSTFTGSGPASEQRVRCAGCDTSGPVASEWSPPIKRAVLVEANLEAVG